MISYCLGPLHPTFWQTKGGHDGLHQAQDEEGAGTHVTQEEHEANAATKLWAQRSTYHVWFGAKARNSETG